MESISNEVRPACGAADLRRLEGVSSTLARLASAGPLEAVRLASSARQAVDALIGTIVCREGAAALTAKEQAVYLALCAAADRAEPCPTADDLLEVIDFGAQSTTVAIVKRLEQRGLIAVRRYQRGRQVQILATGRWTREPKCRAPHWRDRLAR